MVRMTTSTVTAKAGNLLASYPGGTFASGVLVATTLTVAHGFSHVNQNAQESAPVAPQTHRHTGASIGPAGLRVTMTAWRSVGGKEHPPPRSLATRRRPAPVLRTSLASAKCRS